MKKSHLKKLSGLSDGSLYYYEKLGLLHPQRTKNNYRVYSKSDAGKVICVQKYNRLGVSVQQLVHTLEEQDIEYMHRIMEKIRIKKEEELERLSRQLSYIRFVLQETEEIQHKIGCFEVTVNTPSVMCEVEKVNQHGKTEHLNIERIENWNRYLEYMDLVLVASVKDIENNEFGEAIWYHSMDKRIADSFHDPFLESLPVSKTCKALTSWIKIDKNSETDMLDQLRETVNYAREHDYRITGRIGARLFLLASDYAYFKVGLELEAD